MPNALFSEKFLVRSALVLLCGASAASAASVTYVGSNGGKWNAATNWSPAAVPVAGDDVFVVQSGTRNITVDQNVVYTAPGLNSLLVNADGSGNLTINSSKSLAVLGTMTLGSLGKGAFNQSSGNNVFGSLILAASDATDLGTYTLKKGSIASTSDIVIGAAGQGIFNHQKGNVAVGGNLSLADQDGSQALYTQSRGLLTVTGTTFVGNSGEARWDVKRGSSTLASLQVGAGSTGNGTVNLQRGTIRSSETTVANGGKAVFNQTGGTHAVTNDLFVGLNAGGTGTYNLSGGSLTVGGTLFLGVAGTGDFNQSGGKVSATGGVVVNDGTYTLTESQLVTGGLNVADGAGFVSSGSTSKVRTTGDVTFGASATISTVDLDLVIAKGSDVNLTVLQTDIGDDALGLVDDYAFRTLTLENNVTLTLDGSALNNALYVDKIDISANDVFRINNIIIGNGINIYYNADNNENRYLGGASYNLGGGGKLIPITLLEAETAGVQFAGGTLSESFSAPLVSAVPEPTTGGLMAVGLLALTLRHRTRRANGAARQQDL